MSFKVEKRIGVRAPAERIWEVISDLPSWDSWNPIEKQASGHIGFGGSVSLTETIPGMPERRFTAKVGDWQPNAQLVWVEKRGFLFASTRFYEIEELQPGSCIVANGFIFQGLRGELFHDAHRKALKDACEAVCEAIRAISER